jgi:hypothetical protein
MCPPPPCNADHADAEVLADVLMAAGLADGVIAFQ